jgi:fumarate reductase subunit D
MSAQTQHKTAFSHLFFWFLFANGGGLAALVLPVHILVQGILGPLKLVPVVDQHQDTWISVVGNPLVKLYILVLVALSFFHFAHRLRYLLVDFGVKAAKSLPAQAIFYGGAALITAVTLWILLTTVPISFG